MRITESEYEEAQKIVWDYGCQIREEKRESELKRLFSTKEGKLAKELGLVPFFRWNGEFSGAWSVKGGKFYLTEIIKGENYRILPNTNDMGIVGHIDFSELEFDNFKEAALKIVEL